MASVFFVSLVLICFVSAADAENTNSFIFEGTWQHPCFLHFEYTVLVENATSQIPFKGGTSRL